MITDTHRALNICKFIQTHKFTKPQNICRHTALQIYRLCVFFQQIETNAEDSIYLSMTNNKCCQGWTRNICMKTRPTDPNSEWWAGFWVRDHCLPRGLGDGLLLFWPIVRERWLTPPAHWSWVINYQAVPCLGQMNISTCLPWNNEPIPNHSMVRTSALCNTPCSIR